jgi:hypothetical protein
MLGLHPNRVTLQREPGPGLWMNLLQSFWLLTKLASQQILYQNISISGPFWHSGKDFRSFQGLGFLNFLFAKFSSEVTYDCLPKNRLARPKIAYFFVSKPCACVFTIFYTFFN